ncbi:hypothetical protein N7451_007584 [Penicillium sp. IBT 35674x]|nr:hypothetical protein N7451_007584 [Penicillium sp. IBT 35674x]
MPDPTTWGEALSDPPKTHCDIGSHFKDHSIIANINICGNPAGASLYYKNHRIYMTVVEHAQNEPRRLGPIPRMLIWSLIVSRCTKRDVF